MSAAFVTLSAAGIAVGPGLSAVLQSVHFNLKLPLVGDIKINGLTAPGLLMFLVWLIFSVVMIITFDEPERAGLHQLKEEMILSPMVSPTGSFSSDSGNQELVAGNHPTPPAGPDQPHSTTKNENLVGHVEDDDDYGQYVPTGEIHHKDKAVPSLSPVDEKEPLLTMAAKTSKKYTSSTTASVSKHDSNPTEKILPDDVESRENTTESDVPSFDSEWSNSSWCFRSPKHLLCFRHFNLQVWICIALLFVDKLTVESIMSASNVITEHRYGWSVEMIGTLGVIIGILVIPLSICVGWLSRRYEDRVILRFLLYVSLFGLLLLIDPSELFGDVQVQRTHYGFFGVGPHRYIYGSLIAFSGLQCMESVIMSALSKVVPHSLAVGVCNSGLINTETGTLGRALGDVAVTFAGLASLDLMLNILIIPLVFIIVGCIIMVQWNYRALAV